MWIFKINGSAVAWTFLARLQAESCGTTFVHTDDATIRDEYLFLRKEPREPPWDILAVAVFGIDGLMPVASLLVAVLILDRHDHLVIGVAGAAWLDPGGEADSLDGIFLASTIRMNQKRDTCLRLVVRIVIDWRRATSSKRQDKGEIQQELHDDLLSRLWVDPTAKIRAVVSIEDSSAMFRVAIWFVVCQKIFGYE